jgi:RNA polymerase sigma factor (sigma-70 family)
VSDTVLEGLLRDLAPQVLGALVRRYGQFDAAEDAVQEALLAASVQWPRDGIPQNPRSWLSSVASRRLVDEFRSESARRRREAATADEANPPVSDRDDTLELLFLCAHPSLSPPSQLALTLRAVGGLSTAEIAAAFLVPEPTMAQRISRAKQTIRASGRGFAEGERAERLRVVRQVLYLIFNEGYTATAGPALLRVELATEAIRLARMLYALVPADTETGGLLALMLLTDARRPARTDERGELVPLDEQDRSRWDTAAIAEGARILAEEMAKGAVGPYQLQAAIGLAHDRAERAEDTDWAEIVALYGLLEQVAPGPMVALNRAVAAAMAEGPEVGLGLLAEVEPQLEGHHRVHAVRAHLLELAGDTVAARENFKLAARQTTSVPEPRHLERRAARLSAH